MTGTLIGTLSLNVSFVLYLMIYLPQIVHNQTADHIVNLSLNMHYLLYIGYILDLVYGFSSDLQWQYKTVSIISLFLITLQHLQLTRHLITTKKTILSSINVLFLVVFFVYIAHFFMSDTWLSEQKRLCIGYASRVCFLLYLLPQLIKNNALKTTAAINKSFVYLSLIISVLDMISAWCLDWGWPNKLAAPVSMTFILLLLIQMQRFKRTTYESVK